MNFWIGLLIGLAVGAVNMFVIGSMCGYLLGYRIAARDKWLAERHDEILERLDLETEWELPEDAA